MENISNSTDTNSNHELENNKAIASDGQKVTEVTDSVENNNSHTSTSPTPSPPQTSSSSAVKENQTTDSEAIAKNETVQLQSKDDIERRDQSEDSTALPTPSDESVGNASTEVHLDVSIADRLSGLTINDNDKLVESSEPLTQDATIASNSNNERAADDAEDAEKAAEISKSILAGDISDHSQCSVDVDGDDASECAGDKDVSGEITDEEMFIEDQDEDVEEEEEFHEVEEEKHKTSQESFGGDKISPSSSGPKHTPVVDVKLDQGEDLNPESKSSETVVESQTLEDSKNEEKVDLKPQTAKNTDWADIMLSNIQGTNEPSEEKPVDEDAATNEAVEAKVEDPEKKELDLDEDVKNPQYIPKKGVFYEHDDRSHEVNSKKQPSTSSKKDEDTVEIKESTGGKKTSSQEKQNDGRRGGRKLRNEGDRWNHDLFRDEKQKPKSKSELINAYGYDIRQERASRNQVDNRPVRGSNNNTNDRQHGSQDSQRSRQNRDNRAPRQNQPSNRSRERRPRRPNNRNRTDYSGTPAKRDIQSTRLIKPELKETKNDLLDGKQSFQSSQTQSTVLPVKREIQDGARDKNTRNDNRGRRLNSKDRPFSNPVDDKLPPINTVMPPITTWSNKIEDMVKEEAGRKQSPPRHHQQQQQQQQLPPQQQQHQIPGMNNSAKNRSNDYWPQGPTNKNIYHERPVRNQDELRHQPQHYNSRRYQDRDETHKQAQFINRNHYGDRTNQHHQDWRRANHYNSYAKPNEYEPIKTQTFENSRLSQANMNRSNLRDAREIINERRLQGQQNFQPKVQPGLSGPDQQRQIQHQHQHQHQHQQQQQQHHHQQLVQQQQQHHQLVQHQHQQLMQQQASQHLRQQQQQLASPQQQAPSQAQQPAQQQQQQPPQPASQTPQQLQNQRPQQQVSQAQQTRQNMVINNMADGVQESGRLNTNNSTTSDLINSRPIIKTDAYTNANVAPHQQQPLQPHSQNHRSMGGPLAQQGPNTAGSHLVPSHLNAAGTQAQYYSPSGSSRESAAAAAALATAYHGYIPSGHSVMDTTRYHMTSQQLSDHGYMASPGQTNDVATASVLHQQGMYTDAASAGGTVASSAYLAQTGSTLSPSSNIPVTGAGPPPLAPVSYLQHSQYPPPPPYSNPYTQPQHNQAPPQSSHAYPYWTYI